MDRTRRPLPRRARTTGVASLALLASLSLSSGCATGSSESVPIEADGSPAEPLVAADGWRAEVVLDVAPTGVWFVQPFDVFPQYAEPELVALDDLGRCWVIVSYGGRWTTYSTGADGTWLGVADLGDVDPRIRGAEVYAGAESGRVWQVVGHPEGVIDRRLVAWLEGRAIHSLVTGDFDPRRDGMEVLAFTEPAEAWLLTPGDPAVDGFEARRVAELSGRIRNAVVLDTAAERAASSTPLADRVLLASRAGTLELWRGMSDSGAGAPTEVLAQRGFGIGRVAVRPGSTSLAGVAYFTYEDGTIWRMAWSAGRFEPARQIHAGHRGPRGIASGRFHADAERESVAIYGYSREVQLLTRPASGAGPWEVETLFVDADKGHGLAAVELDGRNDTDELVLCGYSGRVVLLARRP
jgi:hypothetical protein